ncbi:hypothetical protein J7K24_00795 [bacterium]|nr:hypothetical protein [bacterium]
MKWINKVFQNTLMIKQKLRKLSDKIYKSLFVLLPPSFYGILAGVLVGVAVNLTTGLVFSSRMKELSLTITFHKLVISIPLVKTAVIFFFVSSVTFAVINVILESSRARAPSFKMFSSKIEEYKKILLPMIVIGIGCFMLGFLLLPVW